MKKLIYVAVLLVLPMFVFAQSLQQTRNLILNAGGIINLLIGIAAALALLAFFWGLVKYIAKAEDEGAKEEGRHLMINGAIALFVLFSIFGIIRFLRLEFGIFSNSDLTPPGLTFPRQ